VKSGDDENESAVMLTKYLVARSQTALEFGDDPSAKESEIKPLNENPVEGREEETAEKLFVINDRVRFDSPTAEGAGPRLYKSRVKSLDVTPRDETRLLGICEEIVLRVRLPIASFWFQSVTLSPYATVIMSAAVEFSSDGLLTN